MEANNKLDVKLVLALAIALAALYLPSAVFAKDAVGIPKAVPFDDTIEVPPAVRRECKLPEKTASFIKKYGKKNVEFVESPNGEGQYLEMSITEVHALGGGAFSGPKWMEVTGHLMENGSRVASFRAKRFSTGGAFAEFKGTCAIIGRCTKAIGKDIARWLKNPVDGAALGDAR